MVELPHSGVSRPSGDEASSLLENIPLPIPALIPGLRIALHRLPLDLRLADSAPRAFYEAVIL
jgi:hypothetical protein